MKNKLAKTVLAVLLCLGLLATSAMAAPRTGVQDANDRRLVISEAGDYTLTGSMRGTVYVDPGAGDVTLTLDNMSIDGGGAPGIVAVSGDNLTIRTAPNSVNSITNGGDSHELGAVVSSTAALNVQNEGRLMVNNGLMQQTRQTGLIGMFKSLISSLMQMFRSNQQSIPGKASPVFPAQPGGNASGEPQGEAPSEPQQQGSENEPPAEPENTDNAPSHEPTQPENGGNTPAEEPAQPDSGETDENSGTPSQEPQSGDPAGQQPGASGEMGGTTAQSSTNAAGEIVDGITYNSAMDLEADYDNAVTYTVTDDDGTVKISESGTYIVTGSSSDGSITVKKGTTGVVLVLEDLDLTSTSGATLSVNKNAEVQVIVSGKVTLTDDEDPADEYSADEDIADAYDGAAIKVKAESVVFITGDGQLTLNGNAKNGIKGGDDSSIIIGGDVEIDITAANDGINSNYDVAILSGDITIDAEDDGIHADHILTIGDAETGEGPDITITDSYEGIEATVINVYGGNIDVTADDDGINAANGDGAYEGELPYSYNQMGGKVTVRTSSDGIDSNGNVNLIGGSAVIRSANVGGDAGIDYDGELYISEDFNLNNYSGVAGPDGMPGQMGSMPGTASGEMRR